jgi:RNA ligase
MPVLLKEILPLDLLDKHLADGVVRRQTHPLYPELAIYNYSEKAQFDRIWDDVTNVCRGLIVAGDEVIARGFNKFHNLNTEYVPETMEANLHGVPLCTRKLDGSMGILYRWDGQWWVATRGSFDSEQARWATKWYRNQCVKPNWIPDHTAVFEIIYPENRIVVEYGFEGLVLLAIVDNWMGREAPRHVLEQYAKLNEIPAVDKFDKTLAECAAENRKNEEGYVLTYPNGVKVKVKFAEYVRLHRIVTGLNPKTIWEMLAKNEEDAVYLLLKDDMPEGFRTWLSGWLIRLRAQFSAIESEAIKVYNTRPSASGEGPESNTREDKPWRKAQALHFQKTPNLCSVLFKMLDSEDYRPAIWAKIKPKATDTFKKDGE